MRRTLDCTILVLLSGGIHARLLLKFLFLNLVAQLLLGPICSAMEASGIHLLPEAHFADFKDLNSTPGMGAL